MASIVDYLKSIGQDSSYASRANMASQYGITGYQGTAAQNTSLLNAIQSNAAKQSAPAPAAQPTPAAVSPDTYMNGVSQNTASNVANYESGYKPSDTVNNAQAYLQSLIDNKPADFQSSYSDQLSGLYDKIMNRKDFSYDLNGDMLYQQYKDQYANLGKNAMMDTMGQASALTGGYGSSYASTAGNQAYQSYLQQLNDKVPELYQLALQKYGMEGDKLNEQFAMTGDMYDQEYGQYRDQVGDYRDDRNFAQSTYDSERNFDYGNFSNMLDYWQGKAGQENADYWDTTNFDYQKTADERDFAYQQQRDSIADSQWAQQFAASQRSSGGSGGSGGSSSGTSSTASQTPANVSVADLSIDDKESVLLNIKNAEGLSSAKAEINEWMNSGYITPIQAGALTRMIDPSRR